MKPLLKLLGVLAAILVLGFVFLRTPDLPIAYLEANYTNDASRFMTLPSGARGHYRLQGNKNADTTLVLLHGSNASLHTWEPLVNRLMDTYRIVTIDLPGHGLTGPTPSEDYTLKGMASMVKEVVNHVGFKTFVLGGNSMGGAVSLTYALEYPADVDRLILIDSSGVTPPELAGASTDLPLAFRIAGTWYGDLIFANITPRSLVKNGLEKSTSVSGIVTDDMITLYHDLARYPGARKATGKRFAWYRRGRKDIDVAGVKKPALLIWGAEDKLIVLAAGQEMKKRMPNADLIVFPKTGHLPMEERPDETALAIDTFLKKTAQTR